MRVFLWELSETCMCDDAMGYFHEAEVRSEKMNGMGLGGGGRPVCRELRGTIESGG